MIEVTCVNFETVFPEIVTAIEKASFVAVDAEFTGLPSARDKRLSLFDSVDERYEKLRSQLPGIAICQFGLAVFRKDVTENRYNADVYTFYLRPPPFGPVDKWIAFQACALKFLCSYNFDFNKCFREGLQYINEDEAWLVEKEIKKKTFVNHMDGNLERDNIVEACSQVSKWLIESKEGVTTLNNNLFQGVDDYVAFTMIREKNPGCWVYRDNELNIVVERVSPSRRQELEDKFVPDEDKRYFETIEGFSRVFKKLVECKKPIVGHNCLCDLLLMFQQFHRPLPINFKRFSKELLTLFPVIFDTKHIFHSIKKEFEDIVSFGRGDLSDLYTTLLRSVSSSGFWFSPHVCISSTKTVEVTPHHAGFDSYASGFIFIKFAHLLSLQKFQSTQRKPMTWTEHLDAVTSFQNRINLIRAENHFLNLSGASAPRQRPKWLHIQARSSGAPLDIEQLTDMLSSYGTIDVKLLSKNSAVLAVGNWGCARDIVRAFRQHPEFCVTSYSALRHSTSVRIALWSALACCSSLSLVLFIQLLRLTSKS